MDFKTDTRDDDGVKDVGFPPDSIDVGGYARLLRDSMPSLAELSREDFIAVAKAAVFDGYVKEMSLEVRMAGIDYGVEIPLFLDNRGFSEGTRATYVNALKRLNGYAKEIRVRLAAFTPLDADNYVGYLKNKGYSPASIDLSVAVAGGLFEFVYRRHFGALGYRNPFRGMKVKPKVAAVRPTVIPSAEEVGFLLETLPPVLSASVAVMSELGLRCGALPSLEIDRLETGGGYRFGCFTKGKRYEGFMSGELVSFLKERCPPFGGSMVGSYAPFRDVSVDGLKSSLYRFMGRLVSEGKLGERYSCHDFRHYFAVREYSKDKDIWRVSRLLGHNGIAVTEKYLKALGESKRRRFPVKLHSVCLYP